MDCPESPVVVSPYAHTERGVQYALAEIFNDVDRWFDCAEELATYKPSTEGWSIREVLEHITLTNHFLMLIIRKGCDRCIKRAAGKSVEPGESDLDVLLQIGQRGSFSWPRPVHMEPTGAKSAAEVRAIMKQQVQECLALLTCIGGGIGSLYRVRMSVNNSGKLDMYQWLFFLAQHARRHLAQMQASADEWEAHGGACGSNPSSNPS